MEGPRDTYDLDGRSWDHQAEQGNLIPQDLADAIVIAFSAACSRLITGLEALIETTGNEHGQPRRAAYAELASRLGMTRDTFRLTFQGQRWLTLPEVQAVSRDQELGDLFIADLGVLLRSGSPLLQTDGFPRPEGGPLRPGGNAG